MPDESKLYYRRNLPHWQRPGAAIFLTWHLDGSLLRSARERLAATRALLEREAIIDLAVEGEEHDVARRLHEGGEFRPGRRMSDALGGAGQLVDGPAVD